MNSDPSTLLLILGLVLVYSSGLLIFTVVVRRRSLSLERRRPSDLRPATSALSKVTANTVSALNATLGKHRSGAFGRDRMERAGLKREPGHYLILVAALTLFSALVGFLVSNLIFAFMCAALALAGAYVTLNLLISRREKKFGEQVPDTLQMLSGGLRAGHSMLRSVDAAAQEQAIPMSDELSRVINETRIGRDLGEALADVATRTKSEDFLWVAQAVDIHREVGGDLAEVLDHVGETIRDRNQIRRQIASLSAEGRMSGMVLVGLPICMFLLLMFMSPTHSRIFTTTIPGFLMILVSAILVVIGSLWMRSLAKIKF